MPVANDIFITNKSDSLVEWNTRYEMGIPEIDAQHKTLITLCNNLYEEVLVCDRNKQKAKLVAALKECTAYVVTHFGLEEELMQKALYPGYAAHKAAHAKFAQEVLDTAKGLESKSTTGALKFVKFLHDWILQHISYEDRAFCDCVKKYLGLPA